MSEITPDSTVNIKGLVCPITFVRSKLALEKVGSGQVLEIILDYPEASRSVPRSMQEQGHEVISVEKINETDWRLLIRKGG
jgi:tRNA 2-thiouridine synthesizing protein A